MKKFKIVYDVQIDDEPKYSLETEADTFEEAKEIKEDLTGSDYYSNIQIIWPEENIEEIKKDTQLLEACEMLELIQENIDNFDNKESITKEEWEEYFRETNRTGDYDWKENNIISVAKVLSELFKQ